MTLKFRQVVNRGIVDLILRETLASIEVVMLVGYIFLNLVVTISTQPSLRSRTARQIECYLAYPRTGP